MRPLSRPASHWHLLLSTAAMAAASVPLTPQHACAQFGGGFGNQAVGGISVAARGIVGTLAPGAVQTEFSLVRFSGDEQRAEKVYAGITPLSAEDVAEVIGFVASRPSHVNIDQIVVRPRDQANASRFNRRS